VRNLIKLFHRDESGATAVEYALLIVFVALAVAAGANTLGQGLSNIFSQVGATLNAAQLPSLP
jgi:pilus assembly protein Flp/PilA